MQENIDNIIKLAWCDKTSFEKIKRIHGVTESEVIKIMRTNLKPRSFKLWRTRVTGRTRKHEKKRNLSEKSFKYASYFLKSHCQYEPCVCSLDSIGGSQWGTAK